MKYLLIILFVLFLGTDTVCGDVVLKRIVDSDNSGNGIWGLYDENGQEVNTNGTTTNGFQEAIDYIQDHGYPLRLIGGGYKQDGTDVSIIYCTSPIYIKPFEKITIHADSVSIIFAPNVRVNGITIDSGLMADIRITGQIGYSGDMAAVAFKPVNGLPLSSATPAMANNKFEFCAIALYGNYGATSKVVDFDASVGAITNNIFNFVEINNGGYGLHVNGLINNQITFGEVHGSNLAGVTISANSWGNTFNGMIESSTGSVGLDMFGNNNIFIGSISNQEGNLAVGYKLEPDSKGNIAILSKCDGGLPVQDSSGNTTNVIIKGGN